MNDKPPVQKRKKTKEVAISIDISRKKVEAIYEISYRFSGGNISLLPRIIPSMKEIGKHKYDEIMTRGLPPYQIDIIRMIQKLTRRETIELAAIFWFGRGDASLKELLFYAEKNYTDEIPYYLAAKPLLAEYLKVGIEKVKSLGFFL